MSTPFDVKEEPEANTRRRQIANEQLEFDQYLINALKSRTGRKFFWRLLERSNIFGVSWVQASFDATAFREGQRSIGNNLLSDILRVAPEAWIEMMKEHQPRPKQKENEDA